MAWTTGVFSLALAVFAAIGLVEQRRMVRDLEMSQAAALLGHLAGMPEFQNDRRVADARLALLQPSMRAAGGDVSLVSLAAASGVEPRAGTLARWPLSLAGQPFELRYESDGQRLAALMRRTALIHAVHGALSIGALLLGLWWILGRNLVVPLREISRAIDRMRAGSGWQFVVPRTDAELSPLVRAVAELGPGLEQQVYQWITAERRAAVATVLSSIRRASAEPMSRLDAAIVECEASAGSAEERVRFSVLHADLGAVREGLEREERYQLAEWTRLGRASVHAGSKRRAGGPGGAPA